MLGFKGEAHTVQRVRQREGAHASAFEEHRASSSESCDTLTLWHCDFMTPRPILSLSSSLSPPLSLLLSLSSSLRHTYKHIRFQLPLVDLTSGADTKKQNKKKNNKKQINHFYRANIQAQAHLYNLTRLEMHAHTAKFLTRCLIWCSLEARKLQRRKIGGKSQRNFQSSLFQENGERGSIASRNCSWPGVLLCMHAHTHTHTLPAPLGASKTPMNAQSKIYSSEKQQPKAFQGRQLGCRACGLTKKACRLQLELTS